MQGDWKTRAVDRVAHLITAGSGPTLREGHRSCGQCPVGIRLALSLWASLVLAGCATPLSGQPTAGSSTTTAPPPPPLTAAALDGLLLTPEEVKVLTAGGVAGGETGTSLLDDGSVDEIACAAVDNIAGKKVYVGSGWTAVRRQQLAEPGDNPEHFVQQAVVAFPAAVDAAQFFTASKRLWADCSNRRYHSTESGKPDVIWTVGSVTDSNGILSTTETQEGGEGWNCQRALTTGNNVTVDILACTYSPTDTAVEIAQRIRVKLRR